MHMYMARGNIAHLRGLRALVVEKGDNISQKFSS